MKREIYQSQTLLLDRLIDQTTSTDRQAAPVNIIRAIILDILENGDVLVQVPPDRTTPICCDVLETSTNVTLALNIGDQVLVMRPEGPEQNGVVLGRISRYRMPQTQANQLADHVVVEAKETLTLKCGESSVDLRKDGKLMIRGKDVLSRAKRSQRIKGGTVGIN